MNGIFSELKLLNTTVQAESILEHTNRYDREPKLK